MSGNQQRTETDDAQTADSTRFSRRRFVQAGAAGAGALALGSTASPAAAQAEELCNTEDEGKIDVAPSWQLMDNRWGMEDAHQCIWLNDDGSYGYDFDARGITEDQCYESQGQVHCINYPEVYCGTRPWGESSGIPEIPMRRGDVDELILEWDVDVNIPQGEWDLAEEWWLMEGEPGSDPDLRYEIMLVLDWGGGHGHEGVAYGVIEDQFGNTIDHWADYPSGGTGADFHIFRISGGAQSGQVDLTEIMDYLDDYEGIDDNLTMTAVEVGNEYWNGAYGDVTYNQLDLTINGSTYTSGSGTTVEPPTPSNVEATDVGTSSATVTWDDVPEADHYNVSLDGSSYSSGVTSTSVDVDGLQPDSSYVVGVESENDGGTSDENTVQFTTMDEVGECGQDAEEATVDGNTVCNVDSDQYFRDHNADGEVTQSDVSDFFGVQHRDAYREQPDMFDYDGDGSVGLEDVLALFADA